MSFDTALQSTVFRAYVLLAAGLLATGGVLLVLLTWGLRRDVRAIWLSFCSWALIAVLVLVCVAAGRAAAIGGLTLVSLAAFREFARATDVRADRALMIVAQAAILATGVCAWAAQRPGGCAAFAALPALVPPALLAVPIVRNRAAGQLRPAALAVLGFLLFGWMLGHAGLLVHTANPYGYLLFLLVAVSVGDIGAFAFGRLLGRRPLRSNISPGKTWEGAAAGLLIALLLPWVLRFTLPDFHWPQLLLAGLTIGIGGPLGDLCTSLVKRECGVKDLGTVVAGQGAVADRIDSLSLAAPLYWHVLHWSGAW